MKRQEALQKLHDLRQEIDEPASQLAALHRQRLQCRRGCSDCCLDGLTVFEIEAEAIRENHSRLLAEGTPHPTGGCAFLDAEGGCRIYADRPYVCRTQGLPLRWFSESQETEELLEQRDICHLNVEGGPPLDHLDDQELWLIGPFELRLSQLQQRYRSNQKRVALRDLFTTH
jgi:Fe-S-cluster containining protein